MFISHKSNIILQIEDTEWQCRRKSKGMTKPEYWTWIESITKDNKVTYPSENFTILEITDENVSERLSELDSYISDGVYNIKVYKEIQKLVRSKPSSPQAKAWIEAELAKKRR